jgi:hypothetical protein
MAQNTRNILKRIQVPDIVPKTCEKIVQAIHQLILLYEIQSV